MTWQVRERGFQLFFYKLQENLDAHIRPCSGIWQTTSLPDFEGFLCIRKNLSKNAEILWTY